jgi:hypothetical protein
VAVREACCLRGAGAEGGIDGGRRIWKLARGLCANWRAAHAKQHSGGRNGPKGSALLMLELCARSRATASPGAAAHEGGEAGGVLPICNDVAWHLTYGRTTAAPAL